MKTLSLLQPWAGLLVLGGKKYETRSFNTKVRGPVAIHASARMPKEGRALLEELGAMYPEFLPGTDKYRICTTLGHVLGQVRVEETYPTDGNSGPLPDQKERMLGDYSPGRFFWKCVEPKVFNKPVPAKGQLGFWEWKGDRYYVVSMKHTGPKDEYLCLWRPNNCDYCLSRGNAGIYTELTPDYHDSWCNMAVPVEVLDKWFASLPYDGEMKMLIPNSKPIWDMLGVGMDKKEGCLIRKGGQP